MEQLETYLGMRPAPEQPKPVAPSPKLLSPMAAFSVDEDLEDLQWAASTGAANVESVERLLSQLGYENTTVEDYTFRS